MNPPAHPATCPCARQRKADGFRPSRHRAYIPPMTASASGGSSWRQQHSQERVLQEMRRFPHGKIHLCIQLPVRLPRQSLPLRQRIRNWAGNFTADAAGLHAFLCRETEHQQQQGQRNQPEDSTIKVYFPVQVCFPFLRRKLRHDCFISRSTPSIPAGLHGFHEKRAARCRQSFCWIISRARSTPPRVLYR